MMQEQERRPEEERKQAPTTLSTTMETFHSASRQIQSGLALPPMWLKMYGDFISKNASSVSQIESALRSLTYIIPGRFRDQEIASESLHSTIQLLSLYHDTLLSKALSKLSGMSAQTPHTRYTRFWTQRSPFYRRTALLLQMIQYTELLWEMAAKRKGEKVRWRVIILLEFLKAICRILLTRITKSRPLVSPPLPQREILPEEPAAAEEGEYEDLDETKKENEGSSWTMPRTGQNLPALPQSTDISKYLLSKVLTCDDIRPAAQLLHKINGSAQLAEYLHILRPVIYAMAMSRNPKSWQPWILGLSIDLAARQLRKDGLRVTSLEKEEWKNRSRQLVWYIMRGPFYDNFTGQFIRGLTSKMKGKIGLDLIAGIVDDYEFLWSSYYFSTATL